MYYIRKYSNGVAIHNDANGCSRLLTEQEVEAVKKEFPQLEDPKVKTVFIDQVKSIPAFVKTWAGKRGKP
jgi:hypothetical protein